MYVYDDISHICCLQTVYVAAVSKDYVRIHSPGSLMTLNVRLACVSHVFLQGFTYIGKAGKVIVNKINGYYL